MLLRRLALASLVANVVIVITGGAVRLTGSGLGCSTWPSCTAASYVPTAEMGVHGIIEFGNRMLGGIVGLIALATLVAALRDRPRRTVLVRLAAVTLAGVAAQGLLGGLTVRTALNPWTVAAHFALSMAVIATAYALWRRVSAPDGPAMPLVPSPLVPSALVPSPVRGLVAALTAASALVLSLGTLVTGSGPHAGDPDTARMGFDIETVAQLHADAVFLLIGLSVGTWFALRSVAAPRAAVRAAAVLIGIELAQGVVGFVQYFTHVPALAVGLHMAGACAVWLGTLAVAFETRVRRPAAVEGTVPAEVMTAGALP